MSRRVVASAALAACALVVVVIGLGLGWWTGGEPGTAAAPARPLAAQATLAPAQALFGDPVDASIEVVLDRSVVRPASVRVEPGFAPYAPRGLPTVTRTTSGRIETIRYDYTLECVSDGCLPGKGPLAVHLPPVVVTASAEGRTRAARAVWPQLLVSSRLPPGAAAAAVPAFAPPSGLPPVRFAVPPGVLVDGLVALAGVLAAAATALLLREGLRLAEQRRRTAALRRTPLEIALERVREAAGRPAPADRRKALGHLAEILAGRGDAALAGTADAAAWAEAAPDRARTLSIAEEVESSASTGAR